MEGPDGQAANLHSQEAWPQDAGLQMSCVVCAIPIVVVPRCTTTNAEDLWVSAGRGNHAQLGWVLLDQGTHDVPVKLLARAAIPPKARQRTIRFVKLTHAVRSRSRLRVT